MSELRSTTRDRLARCARVSHGVCNLTRRPWSLDVFWAMREGNGLSVLPLVAPKFGVCPTPGDAGVRPEGPRTSTAFRAYSLEEIRAVSGAIGRWPMPFALAQGHGEQSASGMAHPALPEAYADAGVRCVLPYDPRRQRFGVGLVQPDGVKRFAVDVEGARFVCRALGHALDAYDAKWGVQSESSSDSAKSSGLPHEGQDVVPLTKSSSALSGESYSPSDSSRHIGDQPPDGVCRSQNFPSVLGWLYATIRAIAVPFQWCASKCRSSGGDHH